MKNPEYRLTHPDALNWNIERWLPSRPHKKDPTKMTEAKWELVGHWPTAQAAIRRFPHEYLSQELVGQDITAQAVLRALEAGLLQAGVLAQSVSGN